MKTVGAFLQTKLIRSPVKFISHIHMSSEHKHSSSSSSKKKSGKRGDQETKIWHIGFRWSVPDSDYKVPPHWRKL